MSDGVRSRRLGPPLLAALLVALPVQAQIVTDGSVGPKVSLRGGEIEIGANLGTQRGDNLFHSFEKFGIATGQTATFTGPGAIKNVISRVTGGEVSNIDGKLRSTVGQADLYFLNPAGVMFGPNAKLDVPGSFHVSTAHELRFADGARFSALDKTGSGLTVAPPEAFGFLDRPLGSIKVDQSELRLTPGKTLSLVGGDIDIVGSVGKDVYGPITDEGAKLSYVFSVNGSDGSFHRYGDPGATLNLVSLASPGYARISDAHVEAATQGTVRLATSRMALQGNGAGKLRVRSGAFFMNDGYIDASNIGELDPGVSIDLQSKTVNINDSWISTQALGVNHGASQGNGGPAGDIQIVAERIDLNDTPLESQGFYGSGPNTVTLQADHITIRGTDPKFGLAVIGNETSSSQGGSINIIAKDTFELHDYAVLTTSTFGSGNAGDVNIRAGRVIISSKYPGGDVVPSSRNLNLSLDFSHVSGIESRSRDFASGNAGHVNITATTIELYQGGQISTSTSGEGSAGNVNIQTDRLIISRGAASAFAGIDSGTTPGSEGAGGTITINARAVQLREGGTIAVQSSGRGKSGSISVNAADTLQFDRARILAETTEANAGDVTLTAGRLFDLWNSTVTTSVAGGMGSGGDIKVDSPLMVLGSSQIKANAKEGHGGRITIQAGQLIRSPNNIITASGSVAGNITIAAPNTDVSRSLTVLPETLFDASSQLREACAARGGRPTSSFTAGGLGGLPPNPGTPLVANSFGQPLKQQTTTGSPTTLTPRTPPAVRLITVAGIPQPIIGSPRLACRG
jgi:filamentous hemagglutinin family protein